MAVIRSVCVVHSMLIRYVGWAGRKQVRWREERRWERRWERRGEERRGEERVDG